MLLPQQFCPMQHRQLRPRTQMHLTADIGRDNHLGPIRGQGGHHAVLQGRRQFRLEHSIGAGRAATGQLWTGRQHL